MSLQVLFYFLRVFFFYASNLMEKKDLKNSQQNINPPVPIPDKRMNHAPVKWAICSFCGPLCSVCRGRLRPSAFSQSFRFFRTKYKSIFDHWSTNPICIAFQIVVSRWWRKIARFWYIWKMFTKLASFKHFMVNISTITSPSWIKNVRDLDTWSGLVDITQISLTNIIRHAEPKTATGILNHCSLQAIKGIGINIQFSKKSLKYGTGWGSE